MHCIVLGSGLGGFVEHFDILSEWAFEEVLEVPFEGLDGHARRMYLAEWEGEELLIISGKFHFYEGMRWKDIVKPYKYVLSKYEVKSITVTSASGGLNARARVGVWCEVTQIWSVPSVKGLACQPIELGSERGFSSCESVTYAYHQGPNTGTLSEYRMLAKLGADLVGMSMLPEWLYLQSQDVETHFLSLPVCSYHPLRELNEPTYEAIIEIAKTGVPKLVQLYKDYLKQI